MNLKQKDLVRELRIKLLKSNYPSIYIVTLEELEAAEEYLAEWLKSINLEPMLRCGNNGLWFKGCELVLEVKTNDQRQNN